MGCFVDNKHVGRLEVIYRCVVSDVEEEVVKWCPVCGAIVVDNESDGRVYPGRIKKMMFPKKGHYE